MGGEDPTDGNISVVRRFIELVNRQDLDAALAGLAPEAELDWSGSEAPDRGVYRGAKAWRGWMMGRWQGLSDARFDPVELVDLPPDRVLLVAHMRGRGRASGLETAALGAAVWTLRDGLVLRLTLYQSKEQALVAVRGSG